MAKHEYYIMTKTLWQGSNWKAKAGPFESRKAASYELPHYENRTNDLRNVELAKVMSKTEALNYHHDDIDLAHSVWCYQDMIITNRGKQLYCVTEGMPGYLPGSQVYFETRQEAIDYMRFERQSLLKMGTKVAANRIDFVGYTPADFSGSAEDGYYYINLHVPSSHDADWIMEINEIVVSEEEAKELLTC